MELTTTYLKEMFGKTGKKFITEETVEELKEIIEDPDYGEDFLEAYKDYFNVLEGKNWSHIQFLRGLKFFMLVESGSSVVEAYIKVFPDRLQVRIDRGQGRAEMTGEASRFNTSSLVNEIRKIASVPVQLLFRHTLIEAIGVQAKLMRGAKSEHVRQKASETLIRELKPTDDLKIALDVNVKESNAVAELKDQLLDMAKIQLDHIEGGRVDIKQLGAMKAGESVIEGEIDEQ